MSGITAACIPITLGDTTYRFSPLTDKQLVEVDEWLKSTLIQTARKSLPPDATPEEREETLAVALREAETLSFTSLRGIKIIATVPGMTYLAWLSLLKEHPEVTLEQLRTHLLNPDNLTTVNLAFKRANRVREEILKKVRRTRARRPYPKKKTKR